MLPALKIAAIGSLFLAGIATAASCLIPELTVAGIWCIPVLGFALLVGAIFRIAIYYDPRAPQSPEASSIKDQILGKRDAHPYHNLNLLNSCHG